MENHNNRLFAEIYGNLIEITMVIPTLFDLSYVKCEARFFLCFGFVR